MPASPVSTSRGISLLLSGALLLSSIALNAPTRADTVTLSLPKASGASGETIDIPLTVGNATGMSALQVLVTYDPQVLEFCGDGEGLVRGGIVPQNAILQAETNVPGRLPVLFVGGVDSQNKQMVAVQRDGILATLRFRVIGNGSQNCPLGLQFAEAFQASEMDLQVETLAGSFSVQPLLPDWWPWAAGALGLVLLAALFRVFGRKKTERRPSRRQAEPELVAVAVDDSVRQKCSGCGRKISIPTQLVGRRVKCPACGAINATAARPAVPR